MNQFLYWMVSREHRALKFQMPTLLDQRPCVLTGLSWQKMVRANLPHSFLWGCLSSSPGWDDVLSSVNNVHDLKNLHGTCNMFSLEEAIKAIQVELFLQVVGSTQKIDDVIEKCKRGLCVSDLPVQEHQRLMDTHATRRLSLVIDIPRWLKAMGVLQDFTNKIKVCVIFWRCTSEEVII